MIALDGKTYELTPEMCVIADAHGDRPIGLGGVMGGESTGCSEETVDVFVESARFEPIRIPQTGRATGINTSLAPNWSRIARHHTRLRRPCWPAVISSESPPAPLART